MWVQEGNDSKEPEAMSDSPLYSSLYSMSRSVKQTITTIGIPMKPVKRTNIVAPKPTLPVTPNKQSITIPSVKSTTTAVSQVSNIQTTSIMQSNLSNEKQPSMSPLQSPSLSVSSTPISPAQFLKNIKRQSKEDTNNRKSNDMSDEEDDYDNYEDDDDDMDGKTPLFVLDDTGSEGRMNDHDDVESTFCDLAVIGQKLPLSSLIGEYMFDQDTNGKENNGNDRDNEDEKGGELPITFMDQDNQSDDDDDDENKTNNGIYNFALKLRQETQPELVVVPTQNSNNILDIERESEWEQCLKFSCKPDALLIVELYSSIFGPSEVIYPLIKDMLQRKDKCGNTQFVRLRVNHLQEWDNKQQVVYGQSAYSTSPIPTFVFIKNRSQVDILQGVNPKQLETILDKHCTKPDSDDTHLKKYTSIMANYGSVQQAMLTKQMKISDRI